MKLLFHITGYKSPEQFSWLYNAVYSPGDLYAIHIDRNAPAVIQREYRAIVGDCQNVFFVPSIGVVWGGIDLIRAEMNAIEQALEINHNWQYLINLTAQDYPLMPLNLIRTQLEKSWPSNFVACHSLQSVHWKIRKRCWFWHIEFQNRRYWTPLPLLPRQDVRFGWYGPWWHILTRDFCRWWVTSAKAQRYCKAHEYIGMPDEMLMQNLVNDSPFEESINSECKHAMIWRYPWEGRKNSAHPNILTMRDLPYLTSSNAFFARKFDQSVDRDILLSLAERIRAPSPILV